jgi:tetratricopeptide (TPR) repeat protein
MRSLPTAEALAARAGLMRTAIAVACAALAACVPAPPIEDSEPPAVRTVPPAAGSSYRGAAILRHARLAAAAREAGDLAAAADHEEVLVLLAPEDPARRKALQGTREAIRRATRAQAESGLAARRTGDLGAARDAFLRVLALDPDNADAAKALREIDFAVMAKSQSDRAARVRATDDIIASAKTRAAESFDLEQRLELVRAGDLNAGLRELRSWVDANPGDRASRQRIGAAVAEKARELESKAQREAALGLYEQAASLAGAGTPEWTQRMQALRKALGEHYYTEGMKVFRSDLGAAIRHWENGARYDPSNTNLQLRLREAKIAQQKLEKIGK